MDRLKVELNIALIPESGLADRLIDLSQSLAERHSTVVRLGQAGVRLTLAPHLTLLQTALPWSAIGEANSHLYLLARGHPVIRNLGVTRYAYNAAEGSFEVQREVTDGLVAMQAAVIKSINPLRGGLLVERDPAGNKLKTLQQTDDRVAENIREAGFAEVGDPRQGGLFRPHDTTNWFELGTQIDLNAEQLPPVETLRGDYMALGLFVLGPYGTCPQLLGAHPLAMEDFPGVQSLNEREARTK